MHHPSRSAASRSRPFAAALALALAALAACRPATSPAARVAPRRFCPVEASAPPAMPFARPAHLLADFWIERTPEPDRVLLDAATVVAHNARVHTLAPPDAMIARVELTQPGLRLPLRRFARDLERLGRAIARGKRVRADGSQPLGLLEELRGLFAATRRVDELRVVLHSTPLRCYPDPRPLYASIRDRSFDLAQCAELRFGEAVRVLGRGPRYAYVHAAYGAGWVTAQALSGPLDAQATRRYLQPAQPASVLVDRLGVWSAPRGGRLLGVARFGLQLPVVSPAGVGPLPVWPLPVWIGGARGLRSGYLRQRAAVQLGPPPSLSRAALFARAFRLLDTPYGWGGVGGRRDCSRLLMDVFATFGIELPRNSRQQSRSGTERIDVGRLDEAAKRAAIEAASRRGVVLLVMPGHIMLYLGRDGDHLYALHQFYGYLTPCAGGGETMQRVNRTTVTSLELGRGSTRRSFIERIDRLVLFAPVAAAARHAGAKSP